MKIFQLGQRHKNYYRNIFAENKQKMLTNNSSKLWKYYEQNNFQN